MYKYSTSSNRGLTSQFAYFSNFSCWCYLFDMFIVHELFFVADFLIVEFAMYILKACISVNFKTEKILSSFNVLLFGYFHVLFLHLTY